VKAPKPTASQFAQLLAHTLGWECVWIVKGMRRSRIDPSAHTDWHAAQAVLSRHLIRHAYGPDARRWPKSVRETIRHTVRQTLTLCPLPAA
jgi:hypothetical protein